MRESASRGFWVSSYAPFGYNRVMVQDGPKKRPTLELDPDASRIVKRIFEMAEAGNGMVHITSTLNDEGIASPRGNPWGKTTLHAILINETYTGTLVWGLNAKDGAGPVRVDDAFPGIVSKAQFDRVAKLMRSCAPKIVNPRRVASPFLLSGLVKCKACRRALTGQYAKSGKFPYYVCQTLMKQGSGSCDTPRLNARRFENLVVEKIRSNILTEGNIRDLVKTVDEKMDRVAAEQHKRLEAIDAELEDVKRHLSRIWHFIGETDNVDMADAGNHIRELRDRQELLEDEASAAREILTQRRTGLTATLIPPERSFAQPTRQSGWVLEGRSCVRPYRPHLRRLEPTVRQACFSYPAELLTREGYRAFGTGQACLNLGSVQSPPLTSTAEFRCDYFFAMQTPLYIPK